MNAKSGMNVEFETLENELGKSRRSSKSHGGKNQSFHGNPDKG